MGKGQSALEYLMIVAVTLAIIIPTTYLFFGYTQESASKLIDYRITAAGRAIVSTAESVYYSGEHSKITIDVDMPEDINGVIILSNREIIFNATYMNQNNELVFFSGVNITVQGCAAQTCAFPAAFYSPGLKHIRIESISNGTRVEIAQANN